MALTKHIEKWEFTPRSFWAGKLFDVKVYQCDNGYTVLLVCNYADIGFVHQHAHEIAWALEKQGILPTNALMYIYIKADNHTPARLELFHSNLLLGAFFNESADLEYFEQRTGEKLLWA